MSFENIILEIDNKIATIFFNRPKALNALNGALLTELDAALDQLAENEEIRVLILTGTGDRAFVAGADITELAQMDPLKAKYFSRQGQKIFSKIENLPFPAIAAVNGFALGGGSEVALACDFIYASDKALFGLPEISLGLIPGFGGTQRLSRLVGKNRAKEMIFTGSNIPAAKALEIGMVNAVFPHDTLMDEVKKTAGIIAAKGSVALRAAKEAIQTGTAADLETGCLIENDAFALTMASPDAKEGTSAFLEKRKAEFTGTLK